MAHIYTGERLKRLRLRQQWTQDTLRYEVGVKIEYDPDVYRMESGILIPRGDSLDAIFKVLGADDGEIICPMLENQPMHVYTLRHILMQALENGDVEKAEEVYAEMATLQDFDAPINQQFLMSQQARIWELRKHPIEEIKAMVMDAMQLTYKEFDPANLNISILLFEEFELLHTLSRLEMVQNNTDLAVKLSNALYDAINNAPIGFREKRQKMVPVLLTRARILQKTGDCNAVIATCDEGLDCSIYYYSARCTPDFIKYKAMALCALGRIDDALPLFKQAYMGYSLLHDRDKANNVIDLARQYDLTFDLHGVDKLDLPAVPMQTYVRRTPPACRTFGDLIRELRMEAGLTRRALCRGIVSEANMSKLETNQIPGHMHYIKPMLERLGVDPGLYCNFYLNKNDYDNQYTRENIKGLLIKRKHVEAEELLNGLESKKEYQKGVNLQFVKMSRLSIYIAQKGINDPEIPTRLLEVLNITCPTFTESIIESLVLSINEINLISYLASYYGSNGDEARAANIYEKLINNLDMRYQDEDGKVRNYTAQLCRLAACLGKLDNKKEALLILNKAVQFNLSHKLLLRLPELLSTKAFYEYKMGADKLTCLAFHYMSYYGFCMFLPKFERHIKIAEDQIKNMT